MKPPSSPGRDLASLSAQHWDLIVIGGGITGAAVLREAARRGLKCLLLEQRDFAWGASSRSGKWVHGGLRYVKQGQLHVTWHSVREREKLCVEMEGLVTMQPMYWPLFQGKRTSEWMIRAGLLLYDLMAGKRWRRTASRATMQQLFPDLHAPGLKGAMCFHEGQTDDARMTLHVIQEARRHGALAFNYAEVTRLIIEEGLVRGVEVSAEGIDPVRIMARQVIAATGAWADQLRRQIHHDSRQHLRPLRGSHLVFDAARLPVNSTLVLEHPRDRRPGFIAPFQGRVIVGNTDLDHRQDMRRDASITREEVDYLLETVQHYFPRLHLGHADIIATFSGVRPVVDSGAADPSRESRDHVVWHEDDLVTIGGGKLTTFEHIARDALQRVQDKFPGLTKHTPVSAGTTPSLIDTPLLDHQQRTRLAGRYGDAAHQMLRDATPDTAALIPGTQTHWLELPWCAANEDVHHLDDLLLRRTRIGLLLAEGGAPLMDRIRLLVQPALGWSDDQWDTELARYKALWKTHYSVPEQDLGTSDVETSGAETPDVKK